MELLSKLKAFRQEAYSYLVLLDESTWDEPAQTIELEDEKLGRLKIRLWHEHYGWHEISLEITLYQYLALATTAKSIKS
jgi:hypothetical protein